MKLSIALAFALLIVPTASYSQSCTRGNGVATTCTCNTESHTIYEYYWTDLQGRSCGKTSDACLCKSGTTGTVGGGTTSGSPSATLPGGTYSNSCNGCGFAAAVLTCSCKKSGGGFGTTSLNINTCQPQWRNLICNNNGQLSCPGPC